MSMCSSAWEDGLGEGHKWHCSIHGGEGCLAKSTDKETVEPLYSTSAWAFIYLPVSQGEGRSPMERWGGAARHQQEGWGKPFLQRAISPSTFHPPWDALPTHPTTSGHPANCWSSGTLSCGHFGVSQTTQGPAPIPFSLPEAGAGLLLWQSKVKSKTEQSFAHHPFGFNKTSQSAFWYQMSKGVCLKKNICTYLCAHVQIHAQVYNLQLLDYNIYHLLMSYDKGKGLLSHLIFQKNLI